MILKKIFTRLHRYAFSHRTVVLFVPDDARGRNDLVAVFRRFGDTWRDPPCRMLNIDRETEHVRTVLAEYSLDPMPIRWAIFAHPRVNGFAVNSDTSEGVLLLRWWTDPEVQYNLFYAHVCRGAEILGRQKWRYVFPSWVSYKDDIGSFVATERGETTWNELFRKIIARMTAGGTKSTTV